jgi:L-asparaginase
MGKPRIGIFALGGTIASLPGGSSTRASPRLGAEELVAALPLLPTLAEIRPETFARVGSPNLQPDQLIALARHISVLVADGEIDGAVITQGTDTLEESAFLLDCVLDLAAPVVVVGAMRNPSLTAPDGPGNLLAGVRVATDAGVRARARELGVLVAMLDDVHSALHVAKTSGHRLDAFASPWTGPVGTIVEERVVLTGLPHRPHVAAMREALGDALNLPAAPGRVSYIPLVLGDDGWLIDLILAAPDRLGHAGVVLGLMGGGHAPATLAEPIGRLVQALPVVAAGRIGGGPLLRHTYAFPGAESDLRERGIIAAGRLHPFKARLLLDLLLRAGAERPTIAAVFETLET